MELDLVIKNGMLVTGQGVFQADLGIRNGSIAAMGLHLEGQELYNADGLLVIPGAVDAHVHLDMPTSSTRTSESWASGTRAAMYGGTTTVIDFVEPDLEQDLLPAFELRNSEAQGQAWIDYSFHMTIRQASPHILAQIPAVIQAGLPSFKLYTTYEDFALSDNDLLSCLEAIGEAGGLAMVHAESDPILKHRLHSMKASNKLMPADYPSSRPAAAEVEAIQRVIALAGFVGTRLYLAHVSTGGGAQAIRQAKNAGLKVSGETCPQYLLLDENCYRHPDPARIARYICAPPLRTPEDNQALWMALGENVLECISTDHCAFNIKGQKDLRLHDFTQIPGGVPGIESRLALIYTYGVGRGYLTLPQWVQFCCTKPAVLFGLAPRKGTLEIGSDADVVIFDPQWETMIQKPSLHENVDYTPYDNFFLRGYPRSVFVHGQLVVHEGQMVGRSNRGRYIEGKSVLND